MECDRCGYEIRTGKTLHSVVIRKYLPSGFEEKCIDIDVCDNCIDTILQVVKAGE